LLRPAFRSASWPKEFKPNATQRKQLRRDSDLVVSACEPWTTEEQFALLRRYLATRHPGGGMAEMDEFDFADMVEQTPVTTLHRRISRAFDRWPPRPPDRRLPDRPAVGWAVDGLQLLRTRQRRSRRARHLSSSSIISAAPRRRGLSYVYLGYWVKGSARMQYKVRFQPLERLGPHGWRRLDPTETEAGLPAVTGGLKFPKL
jgi:arginyl-tRNA--protein-N-Asp/Glu arginylyltransferase